MCSTNVRFYIGRLLHIFLAKILHFLDSHGWLLGEDVDILPSLLLPLAGGEELCESENDKLPMELQYLEDDKERESDPEIRMMLIECLMMVRLGKQV